MLQDGGFRTASRAARGAPHRHAPRSLPKTLGGRLYESLLRIIGISHTTMGKHARKLKGRGASDARAFALLGLISLAISILAWSITPVIGI